MPENLPDRPAPRSREELERPYRRPFRHIVAATWRAHPPLRWWTPLSVVLLAVGAIGLAAGEPLLGLLGGTGAMLFWLALIGWVLASARETWRLTRAWAQKSELRSVLEARPQAGEEDPELTHDRFAVTVEDDGWLLTWRFRPLRIAEQPGDEEIEVPGRPRHAAMVITERPFAPQDAARAAEQLVAAQEDAAAREQAAVAAAHHGIADADERATRAIEARTTAAALRSATGQDARGRRRPRPRS